MRAKQILEDIGVEAKRMETDHEVQMARAELYRAAQYSIQLHQMLKNISEEQGLEGWVQAKITKASDYLSSVKHHLEYKMLDANSEAGMPDVQVAPEQGEE
jgi:regulator of sirC expression with transglutaminase-like and TPR domain